MKSKVAIAVEAFWDVERVLLLLEKKQKALEEALSVKFTDEELSEYMTATRKIELDFQEKRA